MSGTNRMSALMSIHLDSTAHVTQAEFCKIEDGTHHWINIDGANSVGMTIHYRTPKQLRAFLDAIAVAAGLS